MAETHFPGCKILKEREEATIDEQYESSQQDWNLASNIFDLDKIRWAIDSFKPFKSAGEDEIVPAFLQNGKDILIISVISYQ